MRKLFMALLWMVAGTSATITAQTLGTDTVALRLIDSTAVEAPYLDFGRPVYDMLPCRQGHYLLVMFRETNKKGTTWKNKGEFGVVRLSDNRLLWTHPYTYTWPALKISRYGVLLTDGNGDVSMLDMETGYTVWQRNFDIRQIDDSAGVVIGYDRSLSPRLHGYSLDQGLDLWKMKAPHKRNWGWENVMRVDSTRLLVVNDDVMLFDGVTGENFVYEAKTGVDDVKGMLLTGLAAVAGAAVGAAAGVGVYYMPIDQNVITKLYAEPIRPDSLHYYFADRREVVCLDSLLTPVWRHELPSKTAARSVLLADDSLLYMLNMGYGLRNGGQPTKMGRPFIAAFDLKSGQQRFMNMLTMKKDMVTDAMLTAKGVYMMFDDGLAYKSNLRDSAVNIVPWDQQRYGQLTSMAHSTVYVRYRLKGTFEPFDFDGQNCMVMTDRGDAYVVNERLDIWEHYNNDQLYMPLHRQDDRVWIYHRYPQPELLLIHKLGLPELRVTVPARRVAFGRDSVFLISHSRIYMFDTKK